MVTSSLYLYARDLQRFWRILPTALHQGSDIPIHRIRLHGWGIALSVLGKSQNPVHTVYCSILVAYTHQFHRTVLHMKPSTHNRHLVEGGVGSGTRDKPTPKGWRHEGLGALVRGRWIIDFKTEGRRNTGFTTIVAIC